MQYTIDKQSKFYWTLNGLGHNDKLTSPLMNIWICVVSVLFTKYVLKL